MSNSVVCKIYKRENLIKFNEPANYKIAVQGILTETFLQSFEGIKILTEKDDKNSYSTKINVRIKDQAELSGIINALYDWGFPILLVEYEDKILKDFI